MPNAATFIPRECDCKGKGSTGRGRYIDACLTCAREAEREYQIAKAFVARRLK